MSLLPTRDRASEKAFLRSLKPHPQESTIVELVEQEKVRFTEKKGEFGCAALDFIRSAAKKIRTKRFYSTCENRRRYNRERAI